MNASILNRAGKIPEDGWHQFEVTGEHINHEAKVVQVIDAKAIDSIMNRFSASKKALGENFAGLLVDKDHFSLDPEQTSEAMGWALELRNREGIPEAKIDWTSAGRPKVEGKDFKFFSTVYEPKDVEVLGTQIVNGKKYQRVRPLALDRLALTNDPNNKGAKPISNRKGNPAGAADENENTTMKILLKKLGLAEDASEESAVTALQGIQNRASQVETLTAERDALLKDQVEADVEKYKNRIKPDQIAAVKLQLIANRKGTIALLESIAEAATETEEQKRTRITNRASAKTPEQIAADAVISKGDEARAQRITNRAHEIQKSKSVKGVQYPFQQAFRDAESAEPAANAK